jgi:hypothetical protein
MPLTDRERWLLNFYRNSELHGALLMGKLARTIADPDVVVHLTRHCATEAKHAAMLSDAIADAGDRIDLTTGTIQEAYARAAGVVPTAMVDLLVLSEVLEHRVVDSYRAHLERSDVHPVVRSTLTAIVQEMEEEHGEEHAGWIDEALDRMPADQVRAAKDRWRAVDRQVAADLQESVNARFGSHTEITEVTKKVQHGAHGDHGDN